MILVKTEAGHQALKDRSVRLSPRQRSAFILFDGKRSVSEVLDAGMGIASEDIEQMLGLGLLGQVGGSMAAANAGTVAAPMDASASPRQVPRTSLQPMAAVQSTVVSPQPPAVRSSQQRYKDAYPIATQLTGSLGLMGFRLNLSVEGTSNYEELLALVPKIRAAVSPEKMQALDRALSD